MTTRHVTVEEVIAYHDALFHADGKAPAPLLQFGKLESGVLRPQATAFQQDAYATLAEKRLRCCKEFRLPTRSSMATSVPHLAPHFCSWSLTG